MYYVCLISKECTLSKYNAFHNLRKIICLNTVHGKLIIERLNKTSYSIQFNGNM